MGNNDTFSVAPIREVHFQFTCGRHIVEDDTSDFLVDAPIPKDHFT